MIKNNIFVKFLLIFFLFSFFSFLSAEEFEEFEEFDSGSSTKKTEKFDSGSTTDKTDEFDEFSEFNGADEFTEIKNISSDSAISKTKECKLDEKNRKILEFSIWVILATIISGILARFQVTRKFKSLVLLLSMIFIGFARGGCPCMISSFIDILLSIFGVQTHWYNYIWFLALFPLTYLFGRTWCGWVCHLGAVQEFLFLGSKFSLLKNKKTQKILKFIQIFLFATLIIQLLVTRTNIFCTIDPFLVVFNLFSVNVTGWVLFGLLMLSSILIYRPFCRAICPVGLLLGFISKLPGASIVKKQEECIGCSVCTELCKIQAIRRFETDEEDVYDIEFDHKECNSCGDCFDVCEKKDIVFGRNPFRKNKKK